MNRILTRLLYAGHLERPEWGVPLRKANHEGLITLETFNRIQDRLKRPAKAPVRTTVSKGFPLRGFVTCGDCARPLTAYFSRSKTGALHPYYMCFNKACPSHRKSIHRAHLEGHFETLLKSVQPAPGSAALVKDMLQEAWNILQEQASQRRAALKRRCAAFEKDAALVKLSNLTKPVRQKT